MILENVDRDLTLFFMSVVYQQPKKLHIGSREPDLSKNNRSAVYNNITSQNITRAQVMGVAQSRATTGTNKPFWKEKKILPAVYRCRYIEVPIILQEAILYYVRANEHDQ